MTSKQSASEARARTGAPAAWVPAIRNRRRFPAPRANAMPSIATRSNGGASRSARSAVRRMRPAAAGSGTDSCDTGATAAAIADSASAGVNMQPPASVLLVAGLEDPQLFVEAVGDGLDFVHRGVVLLRLHGPQLREAILVVRAALLERDHLEVEAGVVRIDVFVELLDQLLRGGHFVAAGRRAVVQPVRCPRINAGSLGDAGGGKRNQGERQSGHCSNLPRISVTSVVSHEYLAILPHGTTADQGADATAYREYAERRQRRAAVVPCRP